MLLFGLMGRENQHFLRFNPPHNCWKETKLSAVNSRAPLCRAGGAPRVLVRRALSHGRPTLNTHVLTEQEAGLKRPNWCFCLAGRFAPLMAPKGRGGGRDVSCVGSPRGAHPLPLMIKCKYQGRPPVGLRRDKLFIPVYSGRSLRRRRHVDTSANVYSFLLFQVIFEQRQYV